jgi:hypothetical protein
VAAGFLAAVTLTLAVACAVPSPATIRHERVQKEKAAARKQASATRERLAVAADGGGQVLRLGVTRQIADAAGLVGTRLGFFQQALGTSIRLQLMPFRSAAAEGEALEAGQLDAAYRHIQAERVLGTNPVQAAGVIEAELAALGARRVKSKSLSRALARIEYTNDPLALSVQVQATRAEAAHVIKRLPPSLTGLYDLGPLNQLLRAAGEPSVPG